MIGGTGDDVLTDTAGSNVFVGGLGQDVMTAGAGSDRFTFVTALDSTLVAPDNIRNFSTLLDKLFVNGAGHDSAFVGNNTVVSLDFNNDTVVDSKVVLTGHIVLTNANFIG
jgi:Ca2+-binding RTX toxin-like protein